MRALILGLTVLAVACAQEPADEVAETPAAEAPAAVAPAGPPSATDSAAVPAAFHGRWDASAEACAIGSEMKLTITEDQLLFHESVAKPTSTSFVSRGPDAIQIEADFSGEGEEWRGTLELSLASDTLTVMQPSGSTDRVRCP